MKLRSWMLVVLVALAAASTAVTSSQHLISSVDQDSDADGLPDRWESQAGLDPRSGAGPDGAAGDPDGDGLTNAQEYEAGTHPRGFHATYLPEAGAGSMAARVALLNPDSQPASVLLTFATADGVRVRRMLQLGPASRVTLGPDALADVHWTEFGTTIESDRRVVVDRAFSGDGVAYSSHGQTSGAAAARTWFIADGDTTDGTNLFYIIQNGHPVVADVEVQYLLPAPQLPLTKIYRVEAHSRSAVWVNAEARTDGALAALSSSGVSAAITSSVPVVVERAIYRGGVDRLARAGHGVLGVTAAAPHWFFAGGATGPAVDMFLTIANPDAAAALVDAEYRLDSGEVVVRHYTVPGGSRSRIRVDEEDPRLAGTTVAAALTSINGVAVVAERSMRVAASAGGIAETHHGTGGGTASRWGIAEGEAGGPAGARTTITITNTAQSAADIQATLFFEDGTTSRDTFGLAAGARSPLDVAERFPSAAGRRFGIVIESMGAPAAELLVEWALQPGAAGASRAFASALARPLPREGAPMQALELSAGSQVVPLRTAAAPAAALTAVPTPGAAAYNVRLATDASPDLTDLDSLIHSTTSAWPTSREKVWALFYWSHRLKRQTAPMMLHGFEVTDPIRNFLDYGFTMCSTISGINQVLYDALGLPHQYWDICNHTVSTVQYEGKFRMIDSSMSNLVTTDDGVSLASLEEAAADYARLVRERSLYATSPNGFLTGSDALRNLPDFTTPTGSTLKGFASNFCPGGLKFQDYYYNWDAGHRYVLNLREDESYTRYYRRLGTTADYWIPSEKIASPNPASTTQIDSANTFGNRGNGVWSWAPRLTPAEWERAVHRAANIASVGSGLAPALPDLPAELVYKVQAGNAIASQKIDAQFSRPDPGATASIAVSINHGASWTEVGTIGAATGLVPLTVNLRSEVSAAYETLVRVQMRRNGGGPADGVVLTGLSITTLTQVNVHGLPKLNIGRNEIFLGLGESSDTMVLWPELRGDLWRTDAYDSSNIASQGVGVPRKYTAAAYPAILTQDAHLTYRMDAPRDITRLVYGGRLHNYRAGSYIDFLHSFDGGQSWIRSYRLSDVGKPYDVLHYETVTDIPPGTRTVLFKYLIHNTNGDSSRASGLYSVRMEVNHRPDISAPPPLEVTLRWKEIAADRTTVDRSHKQRVGEFPFRYVVNVGGSDHPVMESITLNVDGAGDGSPAGYSDGVDAGGQKYVYRKRTDGMNLAAQKPYTISRAPSGFGSSAGAANTTILTDGVVGAPGTGGIAYWWGQCWTSGQNVDLLVDLGAPQAVGAFRAHLFGYASWDALKGQVQDRVEVSSSVDGVDFVSHGLLDTSLWRKDIPINHLLPDDGKATGWNFERTVPAAVTARYVRYRITPKRNLCVSELQVLDRVVYEPFDIRIAPPTWLEPPPGPVNVAPTIALTSPGAGAYFAAPATVLVSADAQDADGGIQLVEFFAGGMPIGTATAAPYTFTWADVPAGEYALTARATDTSGAETTSDPIALVVDPAPPASDIPPQVALTSPATGLTLTAPATATLTADATDPDDGVARVQFFANGVLLGQATTAPYSLTWSDIPAGQYSLTARATDPAGAATTSNAVLLTVDAPPPPPVAPAIDEIVIHAAPAAQIVGGWVVTADSTAASGARLQNPNANAPKVSSPLAAPTQAFDLTFQAEAGKGYRLWLRGKALSNSYSNDSVFVQFAGSVDAAGVPTWRIDSTDGSTVILEDCSGCGLSGWGWADNGYGTNVLGPLVYFAATGPQRLRVQMREDGLGIDQVVLSAVRYLQTPPGAAKNDTTILEATPIVVGPPSNAAPSVSLTAPAEGPPPVAPATITLRAAASDPDGTITAVEFYAGSNLLARVTDSPFTATWTDVAAGTYSLTARAIDDGGATTTSAPVLFSVAAPPPPPPPAGAPVDEIVLYAAVDAQVLGGWTVVADATAAAGSRLQNPNANLPKVSIASATPAAAFDLTFTADAGKPYRLWLRGKALGDSYSNDSVFVQFDGSVDAAGTPQWRTGTTSSTTVILEECGGCGLQGWGWADNGYGMNVLGPVVYFAETGPQRVRIQMREDGLAIDQVVLSAVAYVTASPGRARSDTVVVPR